MSGFLSPAWLVVCMVLVSAGIGKLRNHQPRSRHAQTRARRVTAAAARPIACGEIMLGAAAAWAPVPTLAALVAATYAVFAMVLLGYLRASDAEGCGCFGAASEAPIHPLQAGLNGVCALVAIGAAFESPYSISWLGHQPPLVIAACAAGLAAASIGVVTAFTVLPGAWQASTRRCSS